jgi:hypothetical protein
MTFKVVCKEQRDRYNSHIHICQLNVSCGQDSMSAIVHEIVTTYF